MQPDLTDTVALIRYWHRQRVYAMEQRKRSDLSLLAFLRMALGWRRDLPDAERKRIATLAASLVSAGEKDAAGKPYVVLPEYPEWRAVIAASLKARAPFEAIEKDALKNMERLAETLPVWEWGKPIRGFGPASLAVIVAEAGDLAAYPDHSKLWKRMGVAVVDGIRQGGLSKTASKDDWIEHGYNRQRRSRMWNIGDALIKSNRDGRYRTIYLARKEYEITRDPEMQPIKAHRRAQRYMEKRLLRDLWRAWRDERRAILHLPDGPESDCQPLAPNEQEAIVGQPQQAITPVPPARLNAPMKA